MEKSKVKVS